MIRFHLLSRLALLAALATCGCGSGPAAAQDEHDGAETPSVDGTADEGGEETDGRGLAPTLSPSTLSPPATPPPSPSPDSAVHLLYGPFPQPWSAQER
jgi:hypothetical protein